MLDLAAFGHVRLYGLRSGAVNAASHAPADRVDGCAGSAVAGAPA